MRHNIQLDDHTQVYDQLFTLFQRKNDIEVFH